MFLEKSNDMTIIPSEARLKSKQIGRGAVVFFPCGGGGCEEGFLRAGGDGVAGLETAGQERGGRGGYQCSLRRFLRRKA